MFDLLYTSSLVISKYILRLAKKRRQMARQSSEVSKVDYFVFSNIFPEAGGKSQPMCMFFFLGEKSEIASYFGYVAVIFRCIF